MAVSKTTSKKKPTTKKSTPRVGGTNLVTKHFFKGWMVAIVVLLVAVVGYAVVHYSEAAGPGGPGCNKSCKDRSTLIALAKTAEKWPSGVIYYTLHYNSKSTYWGTSRSALTWKGSNATVKWCYEWAVDRTSTYHFKQWVRGVKIADNYTYGIKGKTVARCVTSYNKAGSKVSAELSGKGVKTLKRVGWKLN